MHSVTLLWLSDALCVPWRQVQCKAEALAPHKAGLVDGVDELAAMGGAPVAVVRTYLQFAAKWQLCLSKRSSAAQGAPWKELCGSRLWRVCFASPS